MQKLIWWVQYILKCSKFQLYQGKKWLHRTLWTMEENSEDYFTQWNVNFMMSLSLGWPLLMTCYIPKMLVFMRLSAGNSCKNCLHQVQWQKHFHCLVAKELMHGNKSSKSLHYHHQSKLFICGWNKFSHYSKYFPNI